MIIVLLNMQAHQYATDNTDHRSSAQHVPLHLSILHDPSSHIRPVDVIRKDRGRHAIRGIGQDTARPGSQRWWGCGKAGDGTEQGGRRGGQGDYEGGRGQSLELAGRQADLKHRRSWMNKRRVHQSS